MSTSFVNPPEDIATFMASALGGLDDVAAATAVVIGVPVLRAPGTSHDCTAASRAIREASLAVLQRYTASPSRTVVDLESGQRTRLKSSLACTDLGDLVTQDARASALAIDAATVARRIIGIGALPVFIGGERGIFSALLDAIRPRERAAVLLISHDLSLPNRAVDCPIAALGVNGLQEESHWHAVAISGTIISADHVHDDGIEIAAATVRAMLAEHQAIYCLVDMAVLDTGHAAGTPDANIGGLTPEQLVGLVAKLDLSARLAGVAVTNVAPKLDRRGQTESVAAEALVTLLAPYLFDALAQ